MRLCRVPAFAIAVGLLACASAEVGRVPLCPPLKSLQPLPAAEACDERTLAEYATSLTERIVERGHRALVRVEFDDNARVRAACVERGVGTYAWRARGDIAGKFDAILSLPPGPSCLAQKRLDLNRYDAKLAEIERTETQCVQQVGTTVETHRGAFGDPAAVGSREFDRCMESRADWIVLDAPGSTRPRIFVKPEIPNPPGPAATDTASRCARTTHRFEEEAACIQADGFEMLAPPPR